MARGRPVRCPYCGSAATMRKGYRKTQTLGLRGIRRCKACKRKFTVRKKEAARSAA